MNIIRFALDREPTYGILDADNVYVIAGDLSGEFAAGEKLCALGDVALLAPVQPRSVACVAANYHALCNEMGRQIPREPEVFLKPPSAVVGHLDDIIQPEVSSEVTCGGELAVVIKRETRRVSEAEALDYVLGYTCANDVSAFDPRGDRFPTRAKGHYTFCPVGPWITTGLDGDNLMLRSRLNGEMILDHSTSGMIFSVSKAVSFISQFMALEPLDIVLMGTPRPETKVSLGDVIEVEIEGIGMLRNRISSSKLTEA
ncbi:MAG: fumarylacetoacetate hydrolase family protein [Anaerolineae bacterium]|nr:MAG: fumarylacetoacetate hydrolase family protein [Anaerolineae bacterium]